jgi:hypothetical protein
MRRHLTYEDHENDEFIPTFDTEGMKLCGDFWKTMKKVYITKGDIAFSAIIELFFKAAIRGFQTPMNVAINDISDYVSTDFSLDSVDRMLVEYASRNQGSVHVVSPNQVLLSFKANPKMNDIILDINTDLGPILGKHAGGRTIALWLERMRNHHISANPDLMTFSPDGNELTLDRDFTQKNGTTGFLELNNARFARSYDSSYVYSREERKIGYIAQHILPKIRKSHANAGWSPLFFYSKQDYLVICLTTLMRKIASRQERLPIEARRSVVVSGITNVYCTNTLADFMRDNDMYVYGNSDPILPSFDAITYKSRKSIYLSSPFKTSVLSSKRNDFARDVLLFKAKLKKYKFVYFFFQIDLVDYEEQISLLRSCGKNFFYKPITTHRLNVIVTNDRASGYYGFLNFSEKNIRSDVRSCYYFSVERNLAAISGYLFYPGEVIEQRLNNIPEKSRKLRGKYLSRVDYQNLVIFPKRGRRYTKEDYTLSVSSPEDALVLLIDTFVAEREEELTEFTNLSEWFFPGFYLTKEISLFHHLSLYLYMGILIDVTPADSGRNFYGLTDLARQIYLGTVNFPRSLEKIMDMKQMLDDVFVSDEYQHLEGASFTECYCKDCAYIVAFINEFDKEAPDLSEFKYIPHTLMEVALSIDYPTKHQRMSSLLRFSSMWSKYNMQGVVIKMDKLALLSPSELTEKILTPGLVPPIKLNFVLRHFIEYNHDLKQYSVSQKYR